MYITVLKSKLHRVKVTSTNIDYDGSCGIDKDWMDTLDIKEYEQVHIYNISNGNRFVTYAFSEDAGSKKISLNGAAAHKADRGDLIIVCTYMMVGKDDKFQGPKLLKIEGMSIQLFKNKYGNIPELNARDDSAGMENFPYDVCI